MFEGFQGDSQLRTSEALVSRTAARLVVVVFPIGLRRILCASRSGICTIDQAFSLPRGLCLSASWWPIINKHALKTALNNTDNMALRGLRGAFN